MDGLKPSFACMEGPSLPPHLPLQRPCMQTYCSIVRRVALNAELAHASSVEALELRFALNAR